jgi:PAS domain S-box-containing protein
LDTIPDPEAQAADTQATAEQRLREAELQYESLFAGAPVACHEIDLQGTVVRVNPTECELLGFDAAEIIGRPIWEFMALEEQEKSAAALRSKLSGEEALTRVEREYKRRDGTAVFLEIHPKLIRDSRGEVVGIRSFMVDITERRLAEQALQKQARELARSNSELEQFAYVASHDLQEPLRKIQAFGDRLKTKCGESLNEDGRDYLGRMQNAAGRMQTLIHDLLALSRVATHPQPFAAVDLHAVAWDVVSDLESRLEHLGGRVELGPLPAVLADRSQMMQLLQNLIGNALKFHKPGQRPVVHVRSEAVTGAAPLCRLIVEDNGIGFDQKYQERIFQIFQRLHGRGEYEGSGIGLAICRKIAERHGGSITAESKPGAGAKFLVTLPCILDAIRPDAIRPDATQPVGTEHVTGEHVHG